MIKLFLGHVIHLLTDFRKTGTVTKYYQQNYTKLQELYCAVYPPLSSRQVLLETEISQSSTIKILRKRNIHSHVFAIVQHLKNTDFLRRNCLLMIILSGWMKRSLEKIRFFFYRRNSLYWSDTNVHPGVLPI